MGGSRVGLRSTNVRLVMSSSGDGSGGEEREEAAAPAAAAVVEEETAKTETAKVEDKSNRKQGDGDDGGPGKKRLGSEAIAVAVKAGNINIHQEEREFLPR